MEECATTAVERNALLVDIQGDQSARIGETARFEIIVQNLSDRRLEDVVIVNDYDEGLYHPLGPPPIRKVIGTLEPNQSRTFPLSFEVRGGGRLCQEVTVTSADGSRATTSICLNAGSEPAGVGGGVPLGGGPLLGQPAFQVQKSGPSELAVGRDICS